MRWSHCLRSRDSRADTDRCRKCVTHFAECYFIITFCDMHNNCQQLDGTLWTLLPLHSFSSFCSLVAATVTINFRIRQLLARMKLLILSDTWSRTSPSMCMDMYEYVCLYVLEYVVIGTSCRMALTKSKLA